MSFDVILIILWTITGLVNLLVPDKKVSKLSYGLLWFCYILELLTRLKA